MAARISSDQGATGAIEVVLDFDVINKRADDLGISRMEIAEALDVDPATIWRWEKRGVKPAFDVVVLLAKMLKLEVEQLTSQGNPTPKPAPGPSSPKPAPAPPTPSKPRAVA